MGENLSLGDIPRQLSAAARRFLRGVGESTEGFAAGAGVLSAQDQVSEALGDDAQFDRLMMGGGMAVRSQVPEQRSEV